MERWFRLARLDHVLDNNLVDRIKIQYNADGLRRWLGNNKM